MLRKKVFLLCSALHTSTSYYVNGKALGVFTWIKMVMEFAYRYSESFAQMSREKFCNLSTTFSKNPGILFKPRPKLTR